MALLSGCYFNDILSASFISIFFTAYILQSTVTVNSFPLEAHSPGVRCPGKFHRKFSWRWIRIRPMDFPP